MPIRFRCEHCDQLLGIARRKAGLPVTCPTCHQQVIVPQHDQPDRLRVAVGSAPPVPAPAPASRPAPGPGGPSVLFERDDFEDLLNAPPSNGSAAPPRRPVPSAPDAARQAPAPPPPVGVFLSPTRATILTVVVIVLLAAAFGTGLAIGRFCFGP